MDNLLPALDEVDYTSGYEGGGGGPPPPQGARVPPEGAPASELKQSASFLRRGDGDKGKAAAGAAKTPSKAKANNAKKLAPPKSRVLEEVQDMMLQSFDDPADDFSNLRKLISEVSIRACVKHGAKSFESLQV